MKQILLLMMLSFGVSSLAQKQIDLPVIEGDVVQNGAPKGWTILSDSPDIIAGNGLWAPQYDYWTVDGVQGDTSDENMGFFIALPDGYSEGWYTPLSNLVVGKKYSVSIRWQQCRYTNRGDANPLYAGGGLSMKVGNTEKTFSHAKSFDDSWHIATLNFTATETNMQLEIRCIIPESGCEVESGCAIVVENAAICPPCRAAGI